MKNENIIKNIIIGVAIVTIIVILGFTLFRPSNSTTTLETSGDITKMVKTLYKNVDEELPELETTTIDASNLDELSTYTGLKSNENIETVVVSAPLMNAIAYNLAVVKVKDNANIETIKQEMLDNINMRRWICVSAEKLYITNTDNIIFLIMGSKDTIQPIYNEFKKYVNNDIGKELEKTNSDGDIELPLNPTPVVD